MTFPYCHNMYKQKNCQSICAILPQFILLKCDMSNEANKFHAYSYKIKRCWHHDYTLPKCRIHYLDITAIRYHPLKRKIYDDFLFFGNICYFEWNDFCGNSSNLRHFSRYASLFSKEDLSLSKTFSRLSFKLNRHVVLFCFSISDQNLETFESSRFEYLI